MFWLGLLSGTVEPPEVLFKRQSCISELYCPCYFESKCRLVAWDLCDGLTAQVIRPIVFLGILLALEHAPQVFRFHTESVDGGHLPVCLSSAVLYIGCTETYLNLASGSTAS